VFSRELQKRKSFNYVLGVFNFSGNIDVVKWLQAAQDAGLYVILRLGPYITAETDFGGFPWWLTLVQRCGI